MVIPKDVRKVRAEAKKQVMAYGRQKAVAKIKEKYNLSRVGAVAILEIAQKGLITQCV